MDDLEFRKRAFANPHEQSPEFLAAARTSPERRQLLLQLQGLDARVKKAAHSIPVPAQLAAKLKALDEQPRNAPSKRARTERLFAVAASLLLAFGLALAPSLFTTRPNAADMQFHDEVIGHVYKEVARYDMNREDMSFEHI